MVGCRDFTTLDLFSGYWQIKVNTSCSEYTIFVMHTGTYQPKAMLSSLMNAPSTLQLMIDVVLKNIDFMQAQPDDMVLQSKTTHKHTTHLQNVLAVTSGNRLKFRVPKYGFSKGKVELLGNIVNPTGVTADPKKATAIQDGPALFDRRRCEVLWGLQAFTGDLSKILQSYLRYFIPPRLGLQTSTGTTARKKLLMS